MTHMFRRPRLGTKRRQRVVALALVHCGRIFSVLSNRIVFRVSETGQAKIHISRRGYSRFVGLHIGAV
jgi:hypothetical protein